MKFSRGGEGAGRHSASDPRRGARRTAPRGDRVHRSAEDPEIDGSDAVAGDGSDGPYDESEAPAGVSRLDLGSLKIPSVPGVGISVQVLENTVTQAMLTYERSVLLLVAFAAPRHESIWDEVRAEIRTSLVSDGVAVEEIPGTYGTELRAKVPSPEGMMDIRFVGIDGPRWMIQAVYRGAAAADSVAAAPLARCLAGVVVDRGREAMPVRAPLPLRMPPELAEAVRAAAEQAARPTSEPAGAPRPIDVPPAVPARGRHSRPDDDLPDVAQPDPDGGTVYGAGTGTIDGASADAYQPPAYGRGGWSGHFGAGYRSGGFGSSDPLPGGSPAATGGSARPDSNGEANGGPPNSDGAPRRRPSPRPRRSE